jgi:uncharacterized membrane protein YgcG
MTNSKRAFGFVLLVASVVVATSLIQAQNRERFGISARAGGVNVVVGRVKLTRVGEAPQLLTNRDNLVAGDVVTTGSLANVEVLLNPGSYFRVSENSEFQLQDDSLDKLRLKLVKGSAVVEVTGVDDMNLNIHVVTSQADFTIMRSGVYRIDVQPGFAELSVRKGRASFGPNKTDVVKGGNQVTFQNGAIARGKLTKDKDDLEIWSNQRAELLARANSRLSARTFGGYMASLNGWDSGLWGSGFGVWAFNARSGFYTFIPFRYGWTSPYGHHYGNYCYGNPWYNGGSGNPVNANNRGSGSTGGFGGGPSGGGSGSGSGSGGSFPSAPMSAPSVQSPPPLSRGESRSISADRVREP